MRAKKLAQLAKKVELVEEAEMSVEGSGPEAAGPAAQTPEAGPVEEADMSVDPEAAGPKSEAVEADERADLWRQRNPGAEPESLFDFIDEDSDDTVDQMEANARAMAAEPDFPTKYDEDYIGVSDGGVGA